MPYLAFYQGLKLQEELDEQAVLLGDSDTDSATISLRPPIKI